MHNFVWRPCCYVYNLGPWNLFPRSLEKDWLRLIRRFSVTSVGKKVKLKTSSMIFSDVIWLTILCNWTRWLIWVQEVFVGIKTSVKLSQDIHHRWWRYHNQNQSSKMKITCIVLFIAVVIVELSAYVTLRNDKRELKEQSN